jgi:hypothetical protein
MYVNPWFAKITFENHAANGIEGFGLPQGKLASEVAQNVPFWEKPNFTFKQRAVVLWKRSRAACALDRN